MGADVGTTHCRSAQSHNCNFHYSNESACTAHHVQARAAVAAAAEEEEATTASARWGGTSAVLWLRDWRQSC